MVFDSLKSYQNFPHWSTGTQRNNIQREHLGNSLVTKKSREFWKSNSHILTEEYECLTIGKHAIITLVTFLVSLPTCTFVGLGDGLRLFRSFSSLLGGLDLSWTSENIYSFQGTCRTRSKSAIITWLKIPFLLKGIFVLKKLTKLGWWWGCSTQKHLRTCICLVCFCFRTFWNLRTFFCKFSVSLQLSKHFYEVVVIVKAFPSS